MAFEKPVKVAVQDDQRSHEPVSGCRRGSGRAASPHSEANPKVMLGKPVIRGTLIQVDLLTYKLRDGMPHEDLLDACPQLTPIDIEAVLWSQTRPFSKSASIDPSADRRLGL